MGKRVLCLSAGLSVLVAAALLIDRPLATPGPPAVRDPSAVVTHGSDVAYVGTLADAGNLSLTPAAVPDSTPPEGLVPGGQGDRVVVIKGGGRVARTSADGRTTRWIIPLAGHVGGVRPPWVVADTDRAYVSRYVSGAVRGDRAGRTDRQGALALRRLRAPLAAERRPALGRRLLARRRWERGWAVARGPANGLRQGGVPRGPAGEYRGK